MRRNSVVALGALNMEKNYSKIQGSEVFGAPPEGSSDNIPPKAAHHSTASVSWFAHNGKFILWFIKFIFVFAVVSVLLAIPIALYHDIENFPEEATEDELQERLRPLYIYNVFTFLLISWLGIAFFYLLGASLPYIFRFTARYVSLAGWWWLTGISQLTMPQDMSTRHMPDTGGSSVS
jgi:hypothetical protein